MTTSHENPKQEEHMFASTAFNLDDYIWFRPSYSDVLYTEIYRYHEAHGGQWDLAHDVGTGAGIVAEELATSFGCVAASDPSAFYLEQTKQRLHSSSIKSKLIFGCHPGEDMSWLPSGSVDMVTIAEAIHWTDHEQVLSSASEVLKPGGTLAIWLYGTRSFFVDPDAHQHILDDVYER
ncbi:S-adenosyl-L-methionine-dependent methyltransferase [Aspergillus aurantiobrunneus]